MGETKLSTWDFVAIGCYFAAVLAVGIFSLCRSNRGTVSGYFLAGRFMIWLPVGASLFASNIGSEHFIGLAGSGAAAGIGVGAFELNACILLQLLGWLFLPVFIASGVCTLPEYMKLRFGGKRIHMYLASLSLLLYILTKISVNLYSGALFIQQALDWNIYFSILLLLGITAITTVTGGLAAVIYMDTLQCFVMVIGAIILAVISFVKIGGFQELYYKYMEAIPNSTVVINGTLIESNSTCGVPRADSWVMLRDPVGSDLPWPAFLLGQTPASIWYWCTDQMMVQRALAAKSLSHAQGGTLFAGWLKLLPLFVIVMPGMISRVLFTDEVACADPEICERVCGNPVGCSNIAYPKLVLELMPTGMKGIMMSVMLAALMSDLTSVFNSASTLFTLDFYKQIRKAAKTRELMIVGRVFVCVMVVLSILWIPIIQGMQGAQLFIYIQVISAYLAPPIAAVYLVAVLWKRANEHGAFWSLMVGLVIGMVRMMLDFIFKEPGCGEEDGRPAILRVHYMYFAMFLFFLTILLMVTISYLTKPPSPEQLIRTTYWTRHNYQFRQDELPAGHTKERQQLDDTKDQGHSNGQTPDLKVTYLPGSESAGDVDGHVLLDGHRNGDGASAIDKEKAKEAEASSLVPVQKQSCWRRGYNWFCGFDDSAAGQRHAAEQELHLKKITSLQQDPRAKLGLLIVLVILISVDIFLYAFFTSGNAFGLL